MNPSKKRVSVPATPAAGMWSVALEWIEGPCRLCISADGEWSFADEADAKCGPDGSPVSHIPASRCLNPDAPVGALIGKIGGSTADSSVEGTLRFVVGRYCAFRLAAEHSGPLFLTINDTRTGYADNGGQVQVTIERSADGATPAS